MLILNLISATHFKVLLVGKKKILCFVWQIILSIRNSSASFLNIKVIKGLVGSDFKVNSENFKFLAWKKTLRSGWLAPSTLRVLLIFAFAFWNGWRLGNSTSEGGGDGTFWTPAGANPQRRGGQLSKSEGEQHRVENSAGTEKPKEAN